MDTRNNMIIEISNKYVTYGYFESIISKYLNKSLKLKGVEACFRVAACEYLDLPQLCHLYLWINAILLNGNKVCLDFKRSDNSYAVNVYNMCVSYGIFTMLASFGDSFKSFPAVKVQSGGITRDDPIIHLKTFKTLTDFDSFLSTLDLDKTSAGLTSLKRYRTILARTGIRDVILKELGQNVIMHSEGAAAVVAVCSKKIKQLEMVGNPTAVRKYASKSKFEEFIQVIVADFGVGIVEKLKNVYTDDVGMHRTSGVQSDDDIIDYAFWKETTSRPTRSIDEAIDVDDLDDLDVVFEPPTGLFFVKQLVLSRHGFMYVRSGSACYALDCAGKNEEVVSIEKVGQNKEKGFSPIPGNLIVLYFPVQEGFQSNSSIPASEVSAASGYISKYIDGSNIACFTEVEIQKARQLIRDIRYEYKKLSSNMCLAVDFKFNAVTPKYLFQILAVCMYLQEKNKPILIIDACQKTEVSMLHEAINEIEGRNELLTDIIIVDMDSSTLSVLGGQEVGWQKLPNDISDRINKSRSLEINKEIDKTFRNNKVLLPYPSRVYIDGYYEISEFIGKAINYIKIQKIICEAIKDWKVSFIIATTPLLEKVGTEIADSLNINPDDVVTVKPNAPNVSIAYQANVKSTDSDVLIISDVIVTGKSISKLAAMLNKPCIIFTIIDGRHDKETHIPNIANVFSMKDVPIKAWVEKPASWRYDQISLVDPVSHKLIKANKSVDEAILKADLSLNELVTKINAVQSGHYSHQQICYKYFFNITTIRKAYNNEIIEIIRKDIEEVCEKKISIGHNNAKGMVTDFCYPQGNKAAEYLTNDLQTYFGGNISFLPRVTTSKGSVYSTPSPALNQISDIAIFIDAAATTGNTIRYAMEWASEIGSDLILIYIIINRMPADLSHFLESIDRYRGVEVKIRSLLSQYLPAYNTLECPLCNRFKKIDTMSKRLKLKHCSDIFSRVMKDYIKVPIKVAREVEAKLSSHESNVLLSQVSLRSMIEGAVLAPTAISDHEFHEQLDFCSGNKILKHAIIFALEREVEFLTNDEKYKQILNADVLDQIMKLTLAVVFDESECDNVKIKAMWVATAIDHAGFVSKISTSKIVNMSDRQIENMLTIIMVNYENAGIESSCNALESIIGNMYDRSDLLVGALREANIYLRFIPSYNDAGVGTYIEALDTLWSLFQETGLSHSSIRTKFDDALRIVSTDDIVRCINQYYLGDSGFYNIVKNKLLPAKNRVFSAWPQEMISSSMYIKQQFFDDITDLDIRLMLLYREEMQKTLSDAKFYEDMATIDEISKRLLKHVFSTDESELKQFLVAAKTNINEAANKCIEKLGNSGNLNENHIRNELDHQVVDIPGQVVTDMFQTILDNAIKYSEGNTDIIMKSTISETFCIIYIESCPMEGRWPSLKEGHGLYRLTEILPKYDGSMHIDNINNNARITITIRIRGQK